MSKDPNVFDTLDNVSTISYYGYEAGSYVISSPTGNKKVVLPKGSFNQLNDILQEFQEHATTSPTYHAKHTIQGPVQVVIESCSRRTCTVHFRSQLFLEMNYSIHVTYELLLIMLDPC